MDQSVVVETQTPAPMGEEPTMNPNADCSMINAIDLATIKNATVHGVGDGCFGDRGGKKLSGDDVRVLGLHEYKQAAKSLADAFADDEVAWYFLDTPDRADWTREEKWQLHVEIFEYIVYAHLLKGLVVCAGPNYDCIALWMPPGANMDDLLTIWRSGMWRLSYKLSKEGRKRFFNEFLPLLHDTKLQVMGARDDESWYLVYLGTKSTSRGKGHARKVIEYVSRQADAEGRACYLESSNLVNRIIYGKLGYNLVKSIYLQRDREHVELDIMVREPIVKKRDSMFDEDSE